MIRACAVIAICLILQDITSIQGYVPPTPPADFTGLIIGLSVGLPFICFTSLNIEVARQSYHKVFNNPEKSIDLKIIGNFSRQATIKCPEELNCDFDKKCKWQNVAYENICKNYDFFTITNKPKNAKMFKDLMGNSDRPEGGSAFAVVAKSEGVLKLYSARIPEHSGTDYLDIEYWLSQPTQLRVCVVGRLQNKGSQKEEPKFGNLKCSSYLKHGKKHRAQFVIQKPKALSKYVLSIEATNFVVDQGAMIMLDSISYSSKLNKEKCEATKPKECRKEDCTILKI